VDGAGSSEPDASSGQSELGYANCGVTTGGGAEENVVTQVGLVGLRGTDPKRQASEGRNEAIDKCALLGRSDRAAGRDTFSSQLQTETPTGTEEEGEPEPEPNAWE
jgi:hypothetical protein